MKKAKRGRWSEDTWAAIFAAAILIGGVLSFYLYHIYTGRR